MSTGSNDNLVKGKGKGGVYSLDPGKPALTTSHDLTW